jgi:hypothetical protein
VRAMERIGAVTAVLVAALTLMGVTPAANAAVAAPARGCVPNGKVLPNATHDVITQKIGDVDLDGHPDTLFHYTNPDSWGVKTYTGAVMVVRNLPLGNVNDQHAWALQLEADPAVMVVDDSFSALPFYLVRTSTGCHFRTPSNTGGKQYTFSLTTTKYGTGVGCLGSDRGGYFLAGRNAVKLANGRIRIDDTEVSTSDGHVAKNGPKYTNGKTYAANSETVARAHISICSQTPTLVISNGGE